MPLDGVSVLGRLTCRLIAPIGPGGTRWACCAGLWSELRDPAAVGARTA